MHSQSAILPMMKKALAAYILRDEFITADPAPIASPRTCEPGPGTWTVTDSLGTKTSIAGGKLVFGTRTGSGDPGLRSVENIFYTAGIGMYFKQVKANSFNLAWLLSTDAVGNYRGGFNLFNGTMYLRLDTNQIIVSAWDVAQTYDYYLLHVNYGTMLFVRGGIYASWTLMGVYGSTAGSYLNLIVTEFNNMTSFEMADCYMFNAGGRWTFRYPYATDFEINAATGTVIDSDPDCVIWSRVSMATGGVFDIYVRRQDVDNSIIVRFDDVNDRIDIIEKSGGIETVIKTQAVTGLGAGSMASFCLTCVGSTIQVLRNATNISVASAFLQTQRGAAITFAGATTVQTLAAFPRLLNPSIIPTGQIPYNAFLVGDSKTAIFNEYYFSQAAETIRTLGCFFRTGIIGLSGYTTAQLQAVIDAQLATKIGTPTHCILNIGVNDILGVMPAQAAFETNYGYILDAMHTKWPTAKILCAYVWARTQDADANTLAGWIGNVLAARAWATIGLDERVTIKSNDDGATYTTDGTHYSDAGKTLAAQVWVNSF